MQTRAIDIEQLTAILAKDILEDADKTSLQEIIGELTKLVPSPSIEEEKEEKKPADSDQPSNDTGVTETLATLQQLLMEMEIESEI